MGRRVRSWARTVCPYGRRGRHARREKEYRRDDSDAMRHEVKASGDFAEAAPRAEELCRRAEGHTTLFVLLSGLTGVIDEDTGTTTTSRVRCSQQGQYWVFAVSCHDVRERELKAC